MLALLRELRRTGFLQLGFLPRGVQILSICLELLLLGFLLGTLRIEFALAF